MRLALCVRLEVYKEIYGIVGHPALCDSTGTSGNSHPPKVLNPYSDIPQARRASGSRVRFAQDPSESTMHLEDDPRAGSSV